MHRTLYVVFLLVLLLSTASLFYGKVRHVHNMHVHDMYRYLYCTSSFSWFNAREDLCELFLHPRELQVQSNLIVWFCFILCFQSLQDLQQDFVHMML